MSCDLHGNKKKKKLRIVGILGSSDQKTHRQTFPNLSLDKKIIITHCFGGIGRDLALKLAACGGEVYGVSRTPEHLQSLKVLI